MTSAIEINFDGLVGPTHNYSGLSIGNVASRNHAEKPSNPKEAAMQGLRKMKSMMEMGLKQAVLPPHKRPHIQTLKRLGFVGTDNEIIKNAFETDPYLIANCSSASAMWTANSGTISPHSDCKDHKTHITPANLTNKFHRSLESPITYEIFKKIFASPKHFVVHPPLPFSNQFGDEGAANHTRFCVEHGSPGLEFFVFGKYAFRSGKPKPKYFPARQTYEASQSIARMHQLEPGRAIFAQQNPIAIDAGVFHNDVASVGNQNVLIYHEQAFFDVANVIKNLHETFEKTCDHELITVKVSGHEVTIQEAVRSYLFNSQLITMPNKNMALICPTECQDNRVVKKCVDRIISNTDNPVTQAVFYDLRQSMQNGGGPACLRLRVVLTEEEENALGGRVILDEALYNELVDWVEKYYRDRIETKDLADPELHANDKSALDELTQILELGSVYEFQKNSF
jgi:succinylarginine dihydrolase